MGIEEFTGAVSARIARSRAAAVRAHIEGNEERLARAADEHIAAMEIDVAWLRTGTPAVTMEELVLRAAPEAGKGLVDALQAPGLDAGERAALAKGWGKAGWSHAKAWLAERATHDQWHRAAKALQRLGVAPRGEDPTLERLGVLARQSEAWLAKLAHCDGWLAREACLHAPVPVLGEGCGRWRAWALARAAGRLAETPEIDEDAAREALADWRWPEVRPPLRVAGVGAGRCRALRGDAAWANAIEAEDTMEHALGEDGRTWLARARSGEDGALERARAKIGRMARRWVALRRTGEEHAPETVLARWRTQWARCEALAGDGAVGTPRLRQSRRWGHRQMQWALPVRGPEALIAACVIGRREPAELARAALGATLEVWMSPHRDAVEGEVYFDEDAVRERTGDGGPAEREAEQGRGTPADTVEAALARAPVIGEMHALAGLREEDEER